MRAVQSGGVPFSFKQVLIDCAKLSARVDEIARSWSSSVIVQVKSSFESMVMSSFGSLFSIWSGRWDKVSAIMSFALGTWVKVILNRDRLFHHPACLAVRR